MFNNIDFISQLPVEVSYQILSYLDLPELANASKVSQIWQKVGIGAWDLYAERIFNGRLSSNGDGRKLLQDYAFQCVKSNDELMDRFQRFLNSLSLGQNGRFRCIIGQGSSTKMISCVIQGKEDGEDHSSNIGGIYDLNLNFDLQVDCFIKSIEDANLKQYGNQNVPGPYVSNGENYVYLGPESTNIFSYVRLRRYNHQFAERVIYQKIVGKSFQAITIFPSLSWNEPVSDRSQLEQRICILCGVKLDCLESQRLTRVATMIISIFLFSVCSIALPCLIFN